MTTICKSIYNNSKVINTSEIEVNFHIDPNNLKEKLNSLTEDINKIAKINFPKRRYAIIHGYIGQDFKGNQKYIILSNCKEYWCKDS